MNRGIKDQQCASRYKVSKRLATAFIACLCLSACQSTSTPYSPASATNAQQVTAQTHVSERAFVLAKGSQLAAIYQSQKADTRFSFWQQKAFVDSARLRYPQLAVTEEDAFYKMTQTKFANQVSGGTFWQFDGVVGDELIFSAAFAEVPAVMALAFSVDNMAGKRELIIHDWRMTHQLVSGSDAYFAYIHNADALYNNGFLAYITDSSKGVAIDEARAIDMLTKLTPELRANPVVMNDFILATFQQITQPSESLVKQAYQGAPSPTMYNAAFWSYYYVLLNDYESYQQMAHWSSMARSRLQTNEDLQAILYAVKTKHLADASDLFLQLVRAKPQDVLAYVAYLCELVEAEQYSEAEMIYRSVLAQFNVKLAKKDFADLSQNKVEAFFNSTRLAL